MAEGGDVQGACVLPSQPGPQDEPDPLSQLQKSEIERVLSCQNDPRLILGVGRESSEEDIKKSYRMMALLLHPDKNCHEGATQAFKVLSQAVTALLPPTSSDADTLAEVDPINVFHSFYPEGFPSESLGEQLLLELASRVGPEWCALGLQLGLDYSFIEGLKTSGSRKILPLDMLKRWQRKSAGLDERKLRQRLISAIKQHGTAELMQLAEEVSSGTVTLDEMVLKTWEKLHSCWKEVGLFLGLKQHVLDELDASVPVKDEMTAKFEMLVAWRKGTRNEAGLIRALVRVDRADLATMIGERCGLLSVEYIKSVKRLTLDEGPHTKLPETDGVKDWQEMLVENIGNFSTRVPLFKSQWYYKNYIADISHLYTRLQLSGSHIYSEQFPHHNNIKLEEVLDGRTRMIVFLGSPGSGKSCVMLHALSASSQAFLQDPAHPAFPVMTGVDAFIYFRGQDCRDSLDNTLKGILRRRCRGQASKSSEHLKNRPNKSLYVFDSLDEIWTKKGLIDDIVQELENNERVIIAGCRTNEPVLEMLAEIPDVTYVEVKGFDDESISQYIEKYFSSMSGQCLQYQKIIKDFSEVVERDKRLQGLFSNPMALCLTCILIRDGKYDPQHLSSLKKIQIYSDIEVLVMARDGIECDKKNLKAFHTYTLIALVTGSGFYENDMKDMGINTDTLPFMTKGDNTVGQQSRGCEMLWPHQSLTEYSAAKCFIESEDKQEELLKFLAAHRNLVHILVFIIEMLEPGEDRLTKIIRYVLALQPSLDQSRSFCQVHLSSLPYSAIKRELSNSSIRTILEDPGRLVSASDADILPCVECWAESKFASSQEGMSVIQNAFKCLRSCQQSDIRGKVFTAVLQPVLPQRLDGAGLYLSVPGTHRQVHLIQSAKESTVMTLKANRVSDVIITQAILLWGNRELSAAYFQVEEIGGVFGDEQHVSTRQEWESLFTDFISNSEELVGEGCLSLGTFSNDLLQALLLHVQSLVDHGMKHVVMKVGQTRLECHRQTWTNLCSRLNMTEINVDGVEVRRGVKSSRQVRSGGWRMVYRYGWFHIVSPTSECRLYDGESLVAVPGPHPRWVKVLWDGPWWYVYSQQPDDLVNSQALTVCRQRGGVDLYLYINHHDNTNQGAAYIPYTRRQWQRLLSHVIDFTPPLNWLVISLGKPSTYPKEKDQYPATSHTQEVDINCFHHDELLAVIGEMITQLHQHGVRWILLQDGLVRGSSIVTFISDLQQQWDIGPAAEPRGGVGESRRGSNEWMMNVSLDSPLITITSEEEKDNLQTLHQTFEFIYNPEYKLTVK